MRAINRAVVALAIGAAAACVTAGPIRYYYDPYYGYYAVVYDDYYYDACLMGGYYYYPTVYYYSLEVTAASASVAVVPPGVRLLLERWGATIDPACVTATSAADSDHDGIPANSTISFQCNASPAGGGNAQVSGSVAVHDLDDTAADAGYSLTFNAFTVHVVSASGALIDRVVNGTEAIQKVGTGLSLTRDLVVNGTNTYPDGVQRPGTLQMKSQGQFTPEVRPGTTQITRGTLLLSGTGTFTGPDGVPVNISRQSDPALHWNNDCTKVAGNAGPYDSGAIVYRSSQGRQTRFVDSSCTSVTATNSTVPAQ